LSILCAVCLAAAPAVAEEARFPVERFRPAIDGSGVLDVDSGQVGQHLQWSVGAFGHYALNPLVLVDENGRGPALASPPSPSPSPGSAACRARM
jgi:hypothetical protein